MKKEFTNLKFVLCTMLTQSQEIIIMWYSCMQFKIYTFGIKCILE